MKKEGHKSLKVGGRYVAPSSLLEDVKKGKNPEKKHLTLDNFFKDSQIQGNSLEYVNAHSMGRIKEH